MGNIYNYNSRDVRANIQSGGFSPKTKRRFLPKRFYRENFTKCGLIFPKSGASGTNRFCPPLSNRISVHFIMAVLASAIFLLIKSTLI
jgi:hypothetical protein